MGSFYQFYWYLSATSIDYMIKNWNRLNEIFSKPLNASPLDFYLNEFQLRTLQKEQEIEKREQEIEKAREEDKMYQLICQIYGAQEKKNQEREKEEMEKLKTQLAKKKAAEDKKKWIREMHKNYIVAKKKNQKKLDEAMLLKDLTEDPMFQKKMEEMGDKELK